MDEGSKSTACPQCGEYVAPAMFRCRECGFVLRERVRAVPGEPHEQVVEQVDEAGRVPQAASQPAAKTRDAAGQALVGGTDEARPVAVLAAEVAGAAEGADEDHEGGGAGSASSGTTLGSAGKSGREADESFLTCECGASLRVGDGRSGRQRKCPKCGALVKAANKARRGSSGRRSAESLLVGDFPAYARKIEQSAPQVSEPVALRRTRLGWLLHRTAKRLERRDGDNSEAATQRRLAIAELAATRDARVVELILPSLEDPWENVRQGAAAALGELGDPRAVPALVRCLGDVQADVRREAALALGKIRDARAVRALHTLAVNDPPLRFAATDALVRIGKGAVPYLLPALESSDGGSAAQALVVLQRLGVASAAEAVGRLLDHRTAFLRAQAAETLGSLGNKAVVPQLQAALKDVDPAVRTQAIRALVRLGDKKSAKAIARLLDDDDTDVRVAAIEAIGVLGDASLASGVVASLHHPDPAVRKAAATTLHQVPVPTAVEPLIGRLDDTDEMVRLKVIEALGRLKVRQTATALQRMLQFQTPALRAKAADALGEIGDRSSVKVLMSSLTGDPAMEVRMAAARALGKLGDPQAIPALESALKDDVLVRCRALTALADLGAPNSLAAVLAMLRDPAPEVRYHATQALATMPSNAHVQRSLEALLTDESPLVRRGAAKTLIKLGDPRGETLLEIAAQTPPPIAQRNQGGPSRLSRMVLAAAVVLVTVAAAGAGMWYLSSSRTLAPVVSPAKPRGKVSALAMSVDGQRVLVGRTLGQIEQWDRATGRLGDSFDPQQGMEITAVMFGKDADTIYFAAGAQVYRVTKGAVAPLAAHSRSVMQIRRDADSPYALSWSSAGDVFVWNLDSGKMEWTHTVPAEQLSTLAVAPEGQRLAWGTPASTVVILNLAENERWRELHLEAGAVTAVSFSPTGDRLAAATADGGVFLCDLAGEASPQRLSDPEKNASYRRVMFTRDGQRLLAVSQGGVEQYLLADEQHSVQVRPLGAPADLLAVDPAGEFAVCGSREHAAFWLLALQLDQPPQKIEANR